MTRYRIAAGIATLISLAACSTTMVAPYPSSWPQLQATPSCEAINGSYELFGAFGDGSSKNRPRIDYWVFGDSRSSPIPVRVDLTYVPATNKVEAAFMSETGTLVESISAVASCTQGQVTISRNFGTQGEGTSGTGVSVIKLMRATDGSLISATHVQTEKRDFLIFPYSRDEQRWALFRRATHDVER